MGRAALCAFLPADAMMHLALRTGLATCMDTLGGGGGDGRQRPIQKAKMEIWLKKSAGES